MVSGTRKLFLLLLMTFGTAAVIGGGYAVSLGLVHAGLGAVFGGLAAVTGGLIGFQPKQQQTVES